MKNTKIVENKKIQHNKYFTFITFLSKKLDSIKLS